MTKIHLPQDRYFDPNPRQRPSDILLVLGQRRRLDLFTGVNDRVDHKYPTPPFDLPAYEFENL